MSEKKIGNEFWDRVSKTDPNFTKTFRGKGGFGGTAISSQYQTRNMTYEFGSCGLGWGIKNQEYKLVKHDPEDFHNDSMEYSAILWYRDPESKEICEIPIDSDIDVWAYSKNYKTWSKTNDYKKKLKTDALTKGYSMLGFNADVFMGLFDDNKYVAQMKKEFDGSGDKSSTTTKTASESQIKLLKKLIKEAGTTEARIKEKYKITAIDKIEVSVASKIIKDLQDHISSKK